MILQVRRQNIIFLYSNKLAGRKYKKNSIVYRYIHKTLDIPTIHDSKGETRKDTFVFVSETLKHCQKL